jgi:hypothetical protein
MNNSYRFAQTSPISQEGESHAGRASIAGQPAKADNSNRLPVTAKEPPLT